MADGEQVMVCDNFSLGIQGNIPPNIPVHNSIYSVPFEKVNIVYHLGNYSSAPMFQFETELRLKKTLDEFIYICEQCSDNNVKLIFASTSSIQGPHTFYSSMRECYEVIADTYYNERGLDYVGLRFFSVYGPGERHKGVYANCITQFIWDMIEGKSPTIYGDGTQSRDFIYVTDIVEALINAQEYLITHEVFELGLGNTHSFNEAIGLLNDALGTQIEPTYIENPISNYVQSTISTEFYRAMQELEWKPAISLRTGIKLIVEHYRNGGT